MTNKNAKLMEKEHNIYMPISFLTSEQHIKGLYNLLIV